MSGRIVYYYERTLTTTVSGIEHIESQSYYGSAVVKIFFQPGTNIAAAQAQVTASSQTVIKQLPTGATPPNILVFDASSVPVLDLQVAADNMTPSQINDIASNLIRPALISVPGVAIPAPYGGTTSDVAVDLDQSKLLAQGLSAKDVGAALALQNIVLPAGDEKIGPIDFLVVTNATPLKISEFNDLPLKKEGNATVYLRDMAHVHQGGPPQQNIVMVEGQQAILLRILKTGDASTLAVVAGVRAKLPALLKTLPPGVSVTPLNDASAFVRASILDVVQEMVTAAVLAGLAVLLFVGSWRSTLIVAASIAGRSRPSPASSKARGRAPSGASGAASKRGSSGSANATALCLNGWRRGGSRSARPISAWPCCPSDCSPLSGKTSSRASSRARSRCTCASLPAPASRRRQSSRCWWTGRSARCCRAAWSAAC